MADKGPEDAFLSAMTTEHFVLQGAISTAVNEQQARASMYLYSLSGALVAFGLMTQSRYFDIFVAAVLPVLYVAGALTTLRLIDISMESLQSFVNVARIREQYRRNGLEAKKLFDPAHGRWPEGRTDSGQISGPFLGLMTTAASMIGVVNAFVGGAGVALVLFKFGGGVPVSLSAALLFALIQLVVLYRYQKWRISQVEQFAKSAGLVVGAQ